LDDPDEALNCLVAQTIDHFNAMLDSDGTRFAFFLLMAKSIPAFSSLQNLFGQGNAFWNLPDDWRASQFSMLMSNSDPQKASAISRPRDVSQNSPPVVPQNM
jgi:hypothetical protein